MDSFRAHFMEPVRVRVRAIPPGQTLIQPLNVVINKPFKEPRSGLSLSTASDFT